MNRKSRQIVRNFLYSYEADRLANEGMVTRQESDAACCYARQDKVWVDDPDGAKWEVYTVLGDAEAMAPAEACC